MKIRAYPLLLILIFCLADAVLAQQPVRVALLPLEVFAQQDVSYLKQQIPEVMKTQLEQQGARVIVLDQDSLASRGLQMDSLAAIRQVGQETGESHVIWGSLTWFGQNFSLDLRMLPPGEVQNPC